MASFLVCLVKDEVFPVGMEERAAYIAYVTPSLSR
jgi:hypothetical protein